MTNHKLAARIAFVLAASGAGAAAQAATIAVWDFGTLAVVAPDNTPAATGGTAQALSAASDVGMTNSYAEKSYNSSVSYDDITNDTNSTYGNQNVWRIRGSSSATSSTGANGWSINAPQYSQGAQFSTDTAGYSNVSLSFNWAATAQGIANLQVQYNTNVNNASGWTNIGSTYAATVANSSSGGSFQTDTVNFGSLANNDANFGVRLVAAYNSTLGTYAAASSVVAGDPTAYNNSSGNWRFADVEFDGTATAPVPLPAGMPLLLSGFGGLALLARKRKGAM